LVTAEDELQVARLSIARQIG